MNTRDAGWTCPCRADPVEYEFTLYLIAEAERAAAAARSGVNEREEQRS